MPWKRYAGLLLVVVIISIPIFSHLDSSPLEIWDESRLANSAIEMNHNHNWLVVMMDGKPEMWSTKPPFMIWMQVLSIRLLGANELATRLPSALAAFGTCLLLIFFFLRKYKDPLPGIIAALVLVTTKGYVKDHGIRTGDYDSILTMCMVGCALFYFLYIDEEKRKYLYTAFVFLIIAGLTKGIASVMFLPGLLLYTIYKKKILFVLKKPDIYIGIGLFIFFVVGYYVLREHYNPGYIAAVQQNELGGRYATVLENHKEDAWYYFDLMVDKYLVWYLLILPGLAIGLLYKNKMIRDITMLSALLVSSYLLIISNAMTKLEWYALPAYPFLAILAGLFLYAICKLLSEKWGWEKNISFNVLPYIFLFLVIICPYRSIVSAVEARSYDPYIPLDRKNMLEYLKDVLHHEKNIDGCQILNDQVFQDMSFYTKEFKYENRPIQLVGLNEINPAGKLVVYRQESKEFIEKTYNTSVISTSGYVTIYQLYGRKKAL